VRTVSIGLSHFANFHHRIGKCVTAAIAIGLVLSSVLACVSIVDVKRGESSFPLIPAKQVNPVTQNSVTFAQKEKNNNMNYTDNEQRRQELWRMQSLGGLLSLPFW
jgi:hypothetical protein